MEYISTREATAKWGISTTRITILANEGRIPGAKRIGRNWIIPASATKPVERKPHQSKNSKGDTVETNDFSFPLYHFRSDWNHITETKLSKQQQLLLTAETAVLECRFEDAYPLLVSILSEPDDIVTEIGCLWNTGICCVAMNKPDEFSRIFLRLKLLLSEDFPHREDLVIIFDFLNTYVDTLSAFANKDDYNTDIHAQALPLTCMLIGYSNLTKEAMHLGKADTTMMKLTLRFLKSTSANIAIEFMHIYLFGIYSLRQDMTEANKHAKAAMQIAYENKLYLPLVSYYSYNALFFDPILKQYPVEFQKHCQQLVLEYEKNFTAFLSSIAETSVISKLSSSDYPIIYGILQGLSYNTIAKKLDIHPQTVIYRVDKIRKKLDIKSRKELKDYLNNYL